MTNPPSIQAALAAVMADVREVRKTSRNESQGFNFRGIDAVVNAVGPALRQHGVIVMPSVMDHAYGSVEVGNARRPMAHVIVQVEYTFIGPAGDSLTACVLGEAMDSGDKAVSKAMSVAFRTALLQALALPTDDPDPDASSYERSAVSLPDDEFNALATQIMATATMPELDALHPALKSASAQCSEAQRDSLRSMFIEQRSTLAQPQPE